MRQGVSELECESTREEVPSSHATSYARELTTYAMSRNPIPPMLNKIVDALPNPIRRDNQDPGNQHQSDLRSNWVTSNSTFVFPESDTEAYVERKTGLRKHWENATFPFANRSSMIESQWFDRILDLHSESQRHYHNLVHLEEMLGLLSLLQQHEAKINEARNYSVMVLAIFFHDVVYDPRSSTNEEDSAALFQEFSNDMGRCSYPDLNDAILSCILATKDHKLADRGDFCCGYLLDVDIAVLGKEPSAYAIYAGLIRMEYDFVERDVYCEKRAQILQAFLETPHIFCTELVRSAFEHRARDNLRKEIEDLQSGIIPGESV